MSTGNIKNKCSTAMSLLHYGYDVVYRVGVGAILEHLKDKLAKTELLEFKHQDCYAKVYLLTFYDGSRLRCNVNGSNDMFCGFALNTAISQEEFQCDI